MDYSPLGSSVHGIFQARILEWVVLSCSRGSSQPRTKTTSLSSPALASGFFNRCTSWEALTEEIGPTDPKIYLKNAKDCWWECKIVQPLRKTTWQFLTRSIVLPYDPATMLLGIYPEELKTYIHMETLTPRFISALFINAKRCNQPRC
ncbi:hypothetical protein R6Z07F_015665 [Ovis aries]